jgi:hypothetical protein
MSNMRLLACLITLLLTLHIPGYTQQPNKAEDKPQPLPGSEYSGMYSFLKDGEFVQVTVEEQGRVTGFVSRLGDLDSDKNQVLDQFFKSGKLDHQTLTFTTDVLHGVAYDFKGTIERGEGKQPGDEAYYVLKGTLTERITDVNQKTSSRNRPVTFKSFPTVAEHEP